MNYQEITPCPQLMPFIKCYWQLDGNPVQLEVERVVPDGRMEMIFHFADLFELLTPQPELQKRSVIAGQITKAISIKPTGRIGMFAVRFTHQGFSAIFEEKADALSEKLISLEDAFHSKGKELEDRICTAHSMNGRVLIIEKFLIERLEKSRVFDKHTRAASHLLYENPGEDRLLQLTRDFGISLRQFERQFKSQVGMSASRFIRIARFQKALRTKLNVPATSFAFLAAECGYYDQAHFSKEFKEISGLTPKSYFAADHEMAHHFV